MMENTKIRIEALNEYGAQKEQIEKAAEEAETKPAKLADFCDLPISCVNCVHAKWDYEKQEPVCRADEDYLRDTLRQIRYNLQQAASSKKESEDC